MRRHRPAGPTRTASLALLAVLVGAAAGCGTTVRERASTVDSQAGLGAPPGGDGLTGTGPEDSGPANAAPAGGDTPAAPGEQGGSSSTGSSSGPTEKGVPTARGAAANKPLEIGVYHSENSAATYAAFGAEGSTGSPGDPRGPYQIVINDLNARGGLLGHKLVPVWAGYNATSGQSMATQQQAACTAFTQDHHVFAALMTQAYYDEGLLACLQKAGVLIWAMPGNGFMDRQQFQKYPLYVGAGTLDLTRAATAYVDGLWAQGYFSSGSRIGLIHTDIPGVNRAIAESLKPALARHGLKLTATAGLPPAYTVSDIPASQISSAVLQFSTARIDRVMQFSVTGAVTMFLFMNNAESQGYRPRYGLSSLDGPGPLTANVPAAQLKGALAVGWSHNQDLPHPAANSQAKVCDRLMVAHGQPAGAIGFWELCDQAKVLVAAAAAGGAPLTADSIIGGLSRLGSLPASSVWSIRYAPGQRDGLAAAAHLAFVDACGCFKYTSAPYQLPG